MEVIREAIEAVKGDQFEIKGCKVAPAPREKAFEDWSRKLEGTHISRLERMRAELQACLQAAKSPEAKQHWKRRLDHVKSLLLGGTVKDDAPAPRPARKAPQAPQPATANEILEGAKYLVSQKMEHMMTERQRQALKEAGL